MSKPLILIGTPCYGSLVAQTYMESILQLMVYASTHNFDVTLALLGGDSLITRSRNKLVATFLDMPQATHLMFIDADIGFPPDALHRLLQQDEDITAGMYPIKNLDWSLMQKSLTPETSLEAMTEMPLHFVGTPCSGAEREERNGFVTGIYAGTGFMLMKRACLERMIKAYPHTKYDVAQVYPLPKNPSQNQYALFDCIIDPKTNIYLSEDFAFCQRWREIGGKIWLDTQTRLAHIGAYKFEGNPKIIPTKIS